MKHLLILFILLLSSNSIACEYSLRGYYKPSIPAGGMSPNEPGLQSPTNNTDGFQIEALCLLSEKRIFFSIGGDLENRKYYLKNNVVTVQRKYESQYRSLFLKSGYSLIIDKNYSAEFGARLGHGAFKFKQTGQEFNKIGDFSSIGIDAKLVQSFGYKYNPSIFLGVGVQKTFVDSFTYRDRTFSSSEFDIGINFVLGVGIGF